MVYLWSCLWLACTTRSPRCYRTNFWTPLGSCSEAGSWRSGWFCCRPWSRWCWWRGHWADWFRLDRWTPGFPWCWLSAEGKGGVRFIIHRQRHKGVKSGWCLLGRKIFITNTTRHTLPPSESEVRNQRCRDGYKIWFIICPLPHTRPPSSSLARCLWSCRCHSPFSLLFPSPPATLFQGQTPLHHYAGMDNSDGGGVRVRREWLGEWGVTGVEMTDKRAGDDAKRMLCSVQMRYVSVWWQKLGLHVQCLWLFFTASLF